jgi:hypothetical protein
MTRDKPPTVAEILAHPSYPDTIFKLTPTQSGKLAVAAKRGGPFNIEWEIHGKGDIKLVVCYWRCNDLSLFRMPGWLKLIFSP